MDIEKLYQDVWARVFAAAWMNSGPVDRDMKAAHEADTAAEQAVKLWSAGTAHAVIAAKAAT